LTSIKGVEHVLLVLSDNRSVVIVNSQVSLRLNQRDIDSIISKAKVLSRVILFSSINELSVCCGKTIDTIDKLKLRLNTSVLVSRTLT